VEFCVLHGILAFIYNHDGRPDDDVENFEEGLRAMRLSMVPPFLDWGPSELCKPVLSSVDVVNLSPDELVAPHPPHKQQAIEDCGPA
jgi:hypothetical protein